MHVISGDITHSLFGSFEGEEESLGAPPFMEQQAWLRDLLAAVPPEPCPSSHLLFLRDLPASERFLRHEPSLLRSLGCLPTWGILLPALLSAAILATTSFSRNCNRYVINQGNKSALYCQRGCNKDLSKSLKIQYCGKQIERISV